MNQKTILTILLVVLVVLVVSLVLVYYTGEEKVEEYIEKEELEDIKKEEVIYSDFFLYSNPDELDAEALIYVEENEELESLMEERRASTFTPFDFIGVEGKLYSEIDLSITGRVIDTTGRVVKEDITLKEEHRAYSGNPFLYCCFSVPDGEGDYSLEILVNGELIETLDFDVKE